MTDPEGPLPGESAEELFENAPCGYLTTSADGTILKVNRTFEHLTGLLREDLVGHRRFLDLLTPGGRIYHETHYAPLLRMQGAVREIALEIVRGDGSRLPVLVNSVLVGRGDDLEPLIRTMVSDATDRRRYEEELLRARKREQEIAQLLQRSLLAGDLPSAPNFEVGVSYRPASSDLDVGGDWYDAFRLDAHRVGLVVGDVVGRGIEAAATMGQLRSAVRAVAATGLTPAGVLEALDAYAGRHQLGRMTTLVYAEVHLDRRDVRFACAGHPPPVIALPDTEPHLVWEGRSAPIDVHVGPAPAREEALSDLPAGSMLVLYTDGLVERRGHSIDEGLARLVEEVEQRRDDGASALATGLVRALYDPAHRDDMCVLVACITG